MLFISTYHYLIITKTRYRVENNVDHYFRTRLMSPIEKSWLFRMIILLIDMYCNNYFNITTMCFYKY